MSWNLFPLKSDWYLERGKKTHMLAFQHGKYAWPDAGISVVHREDHTLHTLKHKQLILSLDTNCYTSQKQACESVILLCACAT